MTDWPREIFVEMSVDVRIRYRRSEHIPIRYAITLETHIDGGWATVRLWDNAHAVDEHHEHEYTRSKGKGAPTVRRFRSVNDAMALAMTRAGRDWQAILDRWRTR